MTLSKIRQLKKKMVEIFIKDTKTTKATKEYELALEAVTDLPKGEQGGELQPQNDGLDDLEDNEDNYQIRDGKNSNLGNYVEVYTLSVAWILFETLI